MQDDIVVVAKHHPLFLMPPPPPPPSSSSPISVAAFPFDPANSFSPRGRKRYLPNSATPVSTPQNEKSVSFHTCVRARDSLSRNDMTPEEIRAYWIQEDEYKAINRRNSKIVRKIEKSYDNEHQNGNSNSNKNKKKQTQKSHNVRAHDLCPRGLEGSLRSEYRTRESAISEAIEKVFEEQEKQYFVGVYDDEAIASAYSRVTSKSLFRAQLRAMLDQKEVEDYCTTVATTASSSGEGPLGKDFLTVSSRTASTTKSGSADTAAASNDGDRKSSRNMLRGVKLGKKLSLFRSSWVRNRSNAK